MLRRQPHRPAVTAALLLAVQVCCCGPAWLSGIAAQRTGNAGRGTTSGAGTPAPDASALLPAPEGLKSTAVERPGCGRRGAAAAGAAAAALAAVAAWGTGALPVRALVKGNAPPKEYGIGKGFAKDADCKVVSECQEIGRKRENEEYGRSEDIQYEKTISGARFKDVVAGAKEAGVARPGSVVQLRYRVMRSGKRSNDGLSGEATTIFSLGYGEDDGPQDAVLTAPLGEGRFVKALDEGIVGMAVGGKRRIQVRPEQGLGWKKPGQCAEAIAAVGIISGLPMGGAENQDFAARRRFSRRFDESLIVEAELVGLGPPK